MPKEVISAAEILGTKSPVTEAEIPVVEAAPPPAEGEQAAPPAGFADPPASDTEPAVTEAPSAAAVIGAAAAETPKPKDGTPPVLAGKSVEGASEPAETDSAKPEVDVQATPAQGNTCTTFVKNIHPGEVIKFKDGTEFVFPRSLYSVFDPELVKKILEVADRYHIVLQ